MAGASKVPVTYAPYICQMLMSDHPQPSSLYVHVPFCQSKCAYCDFNSYAGLERLQEPYVEALLTEMGLRSARPAGGARWPEPMLQTIYLGGGTPTALSAELLARVLAACRAHWRVSPNAEITVEANPGTLDQAKLATLLEQGLTRLSLGVQTFDDALLRQLGRIHTAQEAIDSFHLARRAGVANINLDLIYGLPGASQEAWQAALDQALALGPDHLSLYALTLHDETPLARSIAQGRAPALDDDLAADMYLWAMETLAQAGYLHYEISNWARFPAAICRHNLTYWLDLPYIGLGAGAHGYLDRRRYWNVAHPAGYIARLSQGREPAEEDEAIGRATEMSETMLLGLRLMEGVSYARFAERFGEDMRAIYRSEIDELARLGLLYADQEGIRLAPRGYLLGNDVFERFLLDEEG